MTFCAVSVVAWSMTGCVQVPRFVPGSAVLPATAQSMCSSLNTSREHVSAFRSLLHATVDAPGSESVSFRYAVVGKDDNKLRIDVLPHEGAYTLALIIVQGSDALFVDTQAKRVTVGCSVKEVLERSLGLQGMTPAAVQALVLGRPPVLECDRVTVHRPTDGKVVFLDLHEQIAWEVDEETGELRRAHFLDSEGATVSAFAERKVQEGSVLITVSVYRPVGATAEMRLVKLNKNSEVAQSTFQVAVPPGYEREGC
jgi:hypothetical protein